MNMMNNINNMMMNNNLNDLDNNIINNTFKDIDDDTNGMDNPIFKIMQGQNLNNKIDENRNKSSTLILYLDGRISITKTGHQCFLNAV